ncbi:hypothetical protein HED60_16605 [Planctomycetales bacterium ZRK34]|nr:hypothetical protein HED60_16605 [Planctomycetales bacterium ZRK34]
MARNAIGCLLAVLFTISACAADRGVSFDGKTQSVRVEAASQFTKPQISVGAWVRFDSDAETQVIANRSERGKLFTLYRYGGNIRMLVQNRADQYKYALAPPPPIGQWTHIFGTYDGKIIRLYYDGKQVAQAEAAGGIPATDDALYIGAQAPALSVLKGALDDVRVYRTALTASQVQAVCDGGEPAEADRIVHLAAADLKAKIKSHKPDPSAIGYPTYTSGTLPTDDGFRGIWYANQASGDEYKFKYSGGMATYPQQEGPITIYAPAVKKTFFVYGGRYKNKNILLHEISYYDHTTGKLARPRILLDKRTDDAHDNPVLSIDKDGYIWIFSNAHGTGRPSYIHRSQKPYDITAFDHVLTTNFSYGQPWYFDKFGFVFMRTQYEKGHRVLYVTRSPDGREWSEPMALAHVAQGHYQVTSPFEDRIATVFNYHPAGKGLNWRTNLYYMQSADGGKTWQNVDGKTLELPLTKPDNPARIAEYESKKRNVYLKDFNHTSDGRPVVMYLTSGGYESGPQNDPRIIKVSSYDGSKWTTHEVTRAADNNYDFASLYIESDKDWRIIATVGPAPQRYNTGGEVVMYTSNDAGVTWKATPLTHDSKLNHNYPRRPRNAAPGFYALWADGNGREMSMSHLYFTTRDGKVFRMPDEIPDGVDMVAPEPVN